MILTGKNKTGKTSSMTGNNMTTAMEEQMNRIFESGKDNDSLSKKIVEEAESNLDENTKLARRAKINKEKRKEKNADTLNIVLPKGERATLKKFCTENSVTMTEYAYTCMDFIRQQVEDGLMTVSKSGIRVLKKTE